VRILFLLVRPIFLAKLFYQHIYSALSSSSEGSSSGQQKKKEQLDAIIKQGLQRADRKKIKYTIAGHEFDLSDQISQAADMVLWTKDWIGDAVSASPQASVVWAGVCLVLPLLTAPHTANEANRDGFTYVTTRIRFYTALEPLLQIQHPHQAAADIIERLVDLYEKILSFQLRSILRFYYSRLKGYAKAVLQQTNWKQLQDDIKALEATINGDLDRLSELVSAQELDRLNKTSTDNLHKMESLLSVSQEQLGVSKAHLGVSKAQLTVTEELRDVAQKLLQSQQAEMRQKLTDEQEKCRHLFRLTTSNKDITYEWYKNRVESRVENTCQFLQHGGFENWLNETSSPLLVSADPGCGKSVLAKYLIDHELPAKSVTGTAICYFFFKDQDQNTARQMLCAVLHQLFTQNRVLSRMQWIVSEKMAPVSLIRHRHFGRYSRALFAIPEQVQSR
jgi:hypothetical protein